MNPNATLIQAFDLLAIAPMAVLFAVSLIPLMIKVVNGNREPNPVATLLYSFIGLVFALGLTATMGGQRQTAFSDAIVVDGLSVWASCMVYAITAVALMLAYEHVATRGRQFAEFAFLMLSSAIGMVILIMSNDLIVTFIGIEIMSLCLYILVAMSREETLSREAAFKYFVLGSFASAIFLYGIALIYGTVGSTYMPEVTEAVTRLFTSNRVFVAGVVLVILGFGFKVSLFPFHAWTPDVYQGSSTPVTAFMATAVKAATFVAFLRFFDSTGYASLPSLLTVLTWMAVLTMTIGNVAAIMQDNFKRMLAYSSVAHSGYVFIGLIAAAFGGNYDQSSAYTLFYLFSYSVMTLGSFALVAAFEKSENTLMNVKDMRGLAKRYPVMALSLTILMLSLAGIPPTLGFFGKLYIFSAAVEADMYWLVFWGVINSVISVYYYLRPLVMMYMSDEEPAEVQRSHLLTRFTIAAAALIVVVLGLLSSPILNAVTRATRSEAAAAPAAKIDSANETIQTAGHP